MPEKETDIVRVTPAKLDNITSRICDLVPYSFSTDEIKNKACKLCNADCREEAERIYDGQKKKNYVTLHRWLTEEQGLNVSKTAVRNHMLYHYRATQRNMALSEYSSDLQQWVDAHSNKSAAIKARIAVLTKDMLTLSSMSEDMEGEDQRKTIELVRKLAETISAHEEKLSQFEDQSKPVTLIFQQLKIIFSEEMEHNNSPAVKKAFVAALSRLQERMGDIIVE